MAGLGAERRAPPWGPDRLSWVSKTKATALAGKRKKRRYRVLFGTRGERSCGKR